MLISRCMQRILICFRHIPSVLKGAVHVGAISFWLLLAGCAIFNAVSVITAHSENTANARREIRQERRHVVWNPDHGLCPIQSTACTAGLGEFTERIHANHFSEYKSPMPDSLNGSTQRVLQGWVSILDGLRQERWHQQEHSTHLRTFEGRLSQLGARGARLGSLGNMVLLNR